MQSSVRSLVALPVENFNCFDNLEAVADVPAERHVHICNQRDGLFARTCSYFHHEVRKRGRFPERLYKRAAAAFYVEYNAVAAGGELLAHNARGNQRQAVHSRSHVAQRIQLLVRGRKIAALTDAETCFVYDS
jgi:hypothetical protein